VVSVEPCLLRNMAATSMRADEAIE
jgi:hypothetical protein